MKNPGKFNTCAQAIKGSRATAAVWVVALLLSVSGTLVFASPEKASAYYESALKLFEKEDTKGAIIQLKNTLKEDGKLLAAHVLLGKALFKDGQLKAAEAAFEEAIKQGVNRGEVAVPMGRVYLALGSHALVLERIQATDLPPGLKAEVLALRGIAYAETGNFRAAERSFEEARSADPKSPIPLIAEVPVLLSQGQVERARTLSLRVIELAPDDANAWNMRASALHAGFDLKGALTAYDKALALQPRHVDARVARAALLVDLKREDDSARDLQFLKKESLNDPRASYLEALLASRKRDSQAVTASLNEVAKLVDALPPAWLAGREQLLMVGALSHHGLRNFEKAREYLEIVVGRNAANLGARKLLASVHLERKDYSRAQPMLETLQKAMPDDPQVQYMLGSTYLAQRRYVQASDLLERAASRAGSAEMSRSLGFSQLGLGQVERGQTSLEKALAANPADFQAASALAMLYLRQGQSQKGLQTAEAMARRDPANLAAISFLASVKSATGDKNGARAIYSEVLAKDPAYRSAALNLARMDAAEGKFDDARSRLSNLLAKRSGDPELLYELGLLEQRARRPVEAIRHLKAADAAQRRDTRPGVALVDLYLSQRDPDQALELASELVSKYPDSMSAQMALGRSYMAKGDMGKARTVFQAMTRKADFDPEMQVAIGRMQLASGNPDGALYNVQKALQGRPDDPGAMALNVDVEERRGSAAKADAALKALTARYPNLPLTLLTAGNLAAARGQHAVALVAYQSALARDESTPNVLNVARAFVGMGDHAKASAFIAPYAKKHPEDLALMRALAETQFQAGQLAAAKQTFAKALTVEPDHAATLNNFANLLQKLGDPDARVQAEKALKLSPNNPSYADTLGWILVQQGQLDAGLRYLREARLRSPGNGAIRYHLAAALLKAGRKSEARDELAPVVVTDARAQGYAELVALKKELGL